MVLWYCYCYNGNCLFS